MVGSAIVIPYVFCFHITTGWFFEIIICGKIFGRNTPGIRPVSGVRIHSDPDFLPTDRMFFDHKNVCILNAKLKPPLW